MPHDHLVNLLLHATNMHSDIPIIPPYPMPAGTQSTNVQNTTQNHINNDNITVQLFQQQNSQRRVNSNPQRPFPVSAAFTSGLFARVEANPTAAMNFIRKIGNAGAPSGPLSTYPGGVSPMSFSTNLSMTEMAMAANPSLQAPFVSMRNPNNTIQPTSTISGLALSDSNLNGQQASSTSSTASHMHPSRLQSSKSSQNQAQQRNSQARPKAPPKVVVPPPKVEQIQEDTRSRESTPASPPYPRAGHGLMAKLPPDSEDLDWLVGNDGDIDGAFSHRIYD